MDLNRTLLLINKSIRDLSAYHLDTIDVPVKLNQNENPYDWPADIKDELAVFCRERPWNRYPPFIPEDLKKALASYTGVQAENVIAGNGSNEMLLVLMMSLLNGTATPIIICQPTFTLYALLARGLGSPPQTVLLKPDLSFDVDAICKAQTANSGSVCIICSPNNPTGSTLDESSIRRILNASSGFVILDQAYIEFGGFNAVPLIKEYPNLIITRTVSKAFAAAGIRLGYMIGNPAVIAEFNRIKLPYNLNFFSVQVVETAIRYRDRIAASISEIRNSRDDLALFLKTLPFEQVYPSSANFILIRCKDKAAVFDWLRQTGILIRDVSHYPMLESCLRITIGTPSENQKLKTALSDFFKGAGKS